MNFRISIFQILFFTLFVILPFSSFGQMKLKTFSPKAMQKDLTEVIETVNGHPDPYTKISEEDFQEIIVEIEEAIVNELDEIDYYKQLAKIISAIKDGHTSLYMTSGWLERARKQNGVFPYEVFLTNSNKLYIVKSYGDSQIPVGAEILEINGMSVNEFIEAVSPLLSYEVIPFRNDRISEGFEFLLYLMFKTSDQLSFKYFHMKEEEAVVSVMDFKEWRKLKKDLKEDRESKIARGTPYDFEIIKPGVAKIDIFSFSVSSMEKYNIFLNNTFKEISENNIHSLIIDVRGNYGGYPKVSSELFHYIHEGYFKTMAHSSMKISHPYRRYFTDAFPELKNYHHRGRETIHSLDIREILHGKIGDFSNEEEFYNETPFTENYEFSGDCYLLMDRKSYSASSSFASTFQCYSMGYIIGESSGGTKIFRANAFFKKLSRTGLNVKMSSTKLFTACYNGEDEVVIPNIEVVPNIFEVVNEIDKQLNTALFLIDEVQKKKGEVDKE